MTLTTNVYRLALVLLTGFAAELLTLTYWQVVRAGALWEAPGNRRPALLESRILRGSIRDRTGLPIASSRFVAGRQVRTTGDPRANAHLVGYKSTRYGRAGLEARFQAELSGVRRAWSAPDLIDYLLGKEQKGNDLVLAIDSRLQVAAQRALGNRRGAVVALAPATGEVLALVSAPSYHPDRVDRDWSQLNADPAKPLVARATAGLYPPGSSFKVVTYAVNAQVAATPLTAEFECTGTLALDPPRPRARPYVVHESEGHAHGPLTLPLALARSCNIVFAQLAMNLGAEEFATTAARFGFGERIPFELPLATSFLRRDHAPWSRNQLAQSGFGQAQVTVTPLQMAMVVGAIANRGVLMEPRLVRELRTAEGNVMRRFAPRAWRQVIGAEAARATLEAMALTTTEGTAAGLFERLPFTVGGKTGTAQNPHGRPHAWFVCVAPAREPKLALAVVVENGGYGARAAAPIARRVLQAWSAPSESRDR